MMPNQRPRLDARSGSRSAQGAGDARRQRGAALSPAAAQAAVAAIGATHRYAAQQAAGALAVGQTLCQTAQRTAPVTPAQGASLQQLKREFLQALLLSVQAAGVRMIDGLRHDQPLPPLVAEERQHIDHLVEWYVYQVHMVLRR